MEFFKNKYHDFLQYFWLIERWDKNGDIKIGTTFWYGELNPTGSEASSSGDTRIYF